MEKAHQPQPRTANNLLRQIITILLLLGGVFVLGLIWTIRYYHVFVDRVTAYVPASAELVMTIPLNEGTSSLWNAFDGQFGQTLSAIRYEKGAVVVLFVDRAVDNGAFTWEIMTDAAVDREALPQGELVTSFRHLTLISPTEPRIRVQKYANPSAMRILPIGSGAGFVKETVLGSESKKEVPLRLTLFEDKLKLQLGVRLRGIIPDEKEFPVRARQMTYLPDSLAVYSLIPTGGSPVIPREYELNSYLYDIIEASRVTSEIVVTEEGTHAALLHSPRGKPTHIEVIEQSLIDELRVLAPLEVPVKLADGTYRIELHRHEGEVGIENRILPDDILVRSFSSEDGRSLSLIVYPDGKIWITNDILLVSGILALGSSSDMPDSECQPTTLTPGQLFSPHYGKDIPMLHRNIQWLFSQFKVNSLRSDDAETELFTFCGYF